MAGSTEQAKREIAREMAVRVLADPTRPEEMKAWAYSVLDTTWEGRMDYKAYCDFARQGWQDAMRSKGAEHLINVAPALSRLDMEKLLRTGTDPYAYGMLLAVEHMAIVEKEAK